MKNLNGKSITDIEQIYIGRDSGCRCGCHGTYTRYYKDPKNAGESASNSRVKSLFTRANNLIVSGDGQVTDDSPRYFNVIYGNNRAITIYWL